MTKRMLSSMAMVACVALLLSGCASEPADAPAEGTTTAPTDGTTTTAPTEPQVTEQYNVLTGLYDIPENAPTRWVGVMIGNNDKSRPQFGIEHADMYIEGETEGGITRIMAVFASTAHIPDTLGPVRSARTPFVKLVQAMDLVYGHAGGSVTALARIRSLGLPSLNAQAYEGSVYWRNSALIQQKGYEYSMMTGREEMQQKLDTLGWRNESESPAPFVFGDKRGTESGTAIQANITGWQVVSFDYDDASGKYRKYNGEFGDREAHICDSGEQIAVQNVIVLYATKSMENELTCDFDLSAGHGIVLTGGTCRNVGFTCSTEQFSITEENGDPLALAAGKTYICIIDATREKQTIVK